MGARNGILVRDRLALETAREIDVVIFDETGTLTEGQFGVVDMATVEGWDALSPAVGALLMSVSTIVVAINAQLLRRVTL
jgi:P-type E1-E2 ATPase